MASFLTLLLNSDPAIFNNIPTKFISSVTQASSLDNAIPIAVRIFLVGAAVAGLRRAVTYLRREVKRGELNPHL